MADSTGCLVSAGVVNFVGVGGTKAVIVRCRIFSL